MSATSDNMMCTYLKANKKDLAQIAFAEENARRMFSLYFEEPQTSNLLPSPGSNKYSRSILYICLFIYIWFMSHTR